MSKITNVLLLLLLLFSNVLWANAHNILLGKKASYSIEPNYALSKGGDDFNLTDNAFKDTKLLNAVVPPWTSKDTVTWAMKRKPGVKISFDMGSQKIIGEIRLGAHSGGDVALPLAALVYISNDQRNWEYLGNLVNEHVVQTRGNVSHKFTLKGLNDSGRYITLYVVSGGFYLNLDEIEVYDANANTKSIPHYGPKIISIDDHVKKHLQLIKQKMTSLALIESAREVIKMGGKALALSVLDDLSAIESRVKSQTDVLLETDEELGLPYTSTDRDVAKLVASYFRKNTGELVSITTLAGNDLWSNSSNPFIRKEASKPDKIQLHMAGNEIEPLAVSIANNSNKLLKFNIKIKLLSKKGDIMWPSNNIDYHLTTHVVASNFGFYDDALLPVSDVISIEPGIVRQLWVFFDSSHIKHGDYNGKLILSNELTESKVLNVGIKVYPIDLKYQDVHKTINWAYLSKGRVKERFKKKHARALKRSHNTVQVVLHEQVPWPKVDHITKKFVEPMQLDFTELDKMIQLRPEVDLWLIWTNMKHESRRLLNYYGATNPPRLNSARHKAFIKEWVRLIKEHMLNLGLGNNNYAFYWFDEPSAKNGFLDVVVPYSRLSKEVDPTIKTFTTHRLDPALISQHPDAIDIHCVPTSDIQIKKHNNKYMNKKLFKDLWHYRTDSLKQLDPHTNYRLHHSYTFVNGLNGAGFWVWNDKGGQWRDQLSAFPSMGMIYRGKSGPVTSKRQEAWREGIEDVALWHAYMSFKSQSTNGETFDLMSSLKNNVVQSAKRNRYKGGYMELQRTRIKALENIMKYKFNE